VEDGRNQISVETKVAESASGCVPDAGQLNPGQRAGIATCKLQMPKELAYPVAAGPDDPLISGQPLDAVTDAGGLERIDGGDFDEWHGDRFAPQTHDQVGCFSGLIFRPGDADGEAEEGELFKPAEQGSLADAFAKDEERGRFGGSLPDEFGDGIEPAFNDLLGGE
jgi:hypothetical protein